jgi:hypothetical protein
MESREFRLLADPSNYLYAGWRKTMIEMPPARPFDLKACVTAFINMRAFKKIGGYTYDHADYEWGELGIPLNISKAEAEFWLVAMLEMDCRSTRPVVAIKLGEERSFEGKTLLGVKELDALFDPQQVWQVFRDLEHFPPEVMLSLRILAGHEALVEWISQSAIRSNSPLTNNLLNGFQRYVWPFFDEGQRERLQKVIKPLIHPQNWPTDHQLNIIPFQLAAIIGLHRELLTVVQQIPDAFYHGDHKDGVHEPQTLIFGLNDPAEVQAQMQRLQLLLRRPRHIYAWLAHTETRALDLITRSICSTHNQDTCTSLMEAFCETRAPEVAEAMLEICQKSKVRRPAKEWMYSHVDHTIPGLLALLTTKPPAAVKAGALAILQSLKQLGAAEILERSIQTFSTEWALQLQRELAQVGDSDVEPLSDENTPQWLREALDEVAKLKGSVPSWIIVNDLPSIKVGNYKLNQEQLKALLVALKKPSNPLILGLRENAHPESLDTFAWHLFETWQIEGAPQKDKWAFTALGIFGGDKSALKLSQLIRIWPGESLHQRAVEGLKILAQIGSDTALMQLNGIAQKISFKALKRKANECMEAIAQLKGLTKAAFEDRIVPDCGLDAQGGCLLDFGPRQFSFMLGPDMKPMVRDEAGNMKSDLPVPNSKDQLELAKAAVDRWKLLKKQIKEVAKIQACRLEQAMVVSRRWSPAEFEKFIVRHPLMRHLARLLLWGGYSEKAELLDCFRITEELDYANAEDVAVTISAYPSIGIVHPLHINEADLSIWGQLLSDYGIIPPFPQLGRGVFKLESSELQEKAIKRFNAVKMPAPSLVFGLEKLGWQRGEAQDAGMYYEHIKVFHAAQVTAVVEYDGSVSMGYIDAKEFLKMTTCYFLPYIYEPETYNWTVQKVGMLLKEVDPVVISETLNDLQQLVSKVIERGDKV